MEGIKSVSKAFVSNRHFRFLVVLDASGDERNVSRLIAWEKYCISALDDRAVNADVALTFQSFWGEYCRPIGDK